MKKDLAKLNLKNRNLDFYFYEVFDTCHDAAERFPNEPRTVYGVAMELRK